MSDKLDAVAGGAVPSRRSPFSRGPAVTRRELDAEQKALVAVRKPRGRTTDEPAEPADHEEP